MNKQMKLVALLLSCTALFFVACDDEPAVGTKLYPEEQIDANVVKAYVSTGLYPINTVSWTLYQTPAEIIKPERDTITFSVKLSKTTETDVKVTLGDNPALVDQYNKANKTNLKALPMGSIKILTPMITIKAGTLESSEKVKAVLDYDKVSDIKEVSLGCISINEVSDGVKVAKNLNVINLFLNKKVTNIKMKGSLDGAEFIDKTKYQLTTETDFGDKWSVNNLTDGNIATSWIYESGKGAYLLFSLNDAVTIKGIRTVPFLYKNFYGYNAKLVKISTSLDNKEWKSQGEFVATLPSSQNPIDIVFYKAINAKYLKLEIVEGYDKYIGYAEVSLAK